MSWWAKHDPCMIYTFPTSHTDRADLLLRDSINLATLKPQKVAPWMVWMTGLKDSSFHPLLYSPRAPTDILTSKKCLVLLKGVAVNINRMTTWLEDNSRKCVASRDWHTNFFLGPQYSNSNLCSSGIDWYEMCQQSHGVLLSDLQVQCQCPCPPQPWL
jgi:hypothetical protein